MQDLLRNVLVPGTTILCAGAASRPARRTADRAARSTAPTPIEQETR